MDGIFGDCYPHCAFIVMKAQVHPLFERGTNDMLKIRGAHAYDDEETESL